MKAVNATLQTTLNSPNQYVIPVFQRYYSWGKSDWENLWNDIVELFEPDQLNRTHFMGSLVFVPEKHFPDKVPTYQVIDGQQRIVTLSLLLCALRNVAIEQQCDSLAQEITQTFLVHPFRKGREYFRVYPRQRDREEYMAAVTNSQPPTGRIAEALTYFQGQIAGFPGAATEEGLRTLFAALQAQLEFVHITLGEENPYRIFRSLNSTGVELSESDLIRNFMFMHVDVEQQDEFDDHHWKGIERHFEDASDIVNSKQLSAFFRDFLMCTGQYVPPAMTFQVFEKRYEETAFNLIALAEQLRSHADFYDIIHGKKPYPTTQAPNAQVNAALRQLRQLDSSTTYPLLLKLMGCVDRQVLDTSELALAISLISGFILRRFICGEQSRAYGRWFVSACASLGDAPVVGLRQFLIGKGFPSDAHFKAQFVRSNVYGSNYARPILESLELAVAGKEPASLANATIEHVMPQTLTKEWQQYLGDDAERVYIEWLNTIGNLTLSAYNPNMQNKPFAQKRLQYGSVDTNIRLTKELADFSSWKEADIVTRGKHLADIAAKVWVGPTA